MPSTGALVRSGNVEGPPFNQTVTPAPGKAHVGIHIELVAVDLRCHSEGSARAAARIINSDPWMSPYHLSVSVVTPAHASDAWALAVDDFRGDHWRDESANEVWRALAPHMADGSTIEFDGPGNQRWRIRWEDGAAFEEYAEEVVWASGQEITAPEGNAP